MSEKAEKDVRRCPLDESERVGRGKAQSGPKPRCVAKEKTMTDYLMLMRNEGNPMEALSPSEIQAHLGKWGEWMGGLAKSGRLKGGQPLGKGAKVVREDAVVDGPYTEAKDVVGGYVIVACDTMEQAIETARGCPTIALGGMVEVRETEPNVL